MVTVAALGMVVLTIGVSTALATTEQSEDRRILRAIGASPCHIRRIAMTQATMLALLGIGIAMLPDYLVDKDVGLVQLLPETEVPSFDTYFAYPDAMKNQAKLHVFRDFVISKARNWSY